MKIQELASLIAKKEGHKSQSRIGDVREILGILSDLMYQSSEPMHALIQNGITRSRKKKK